MDSSTAIVEDCKQFWEAVVQHTNLINILMKNEIATLADQNFNLCPYGTVQITASPAVPLGTNFMSDVFIVNASAGDKKFKSFVKVLPSNPSRLAAGFIGGSYHRESIVYQQWLPELKQLRSEKNLSSLDIPLIVAESYVVKFVLSEDGARLENDTVCILEDLKSKCYRMSTLAKTTSGIDLMHAKTALRTYAGYHALSIANLRRLRVDDGSYKLPSSYEIFLKDPNYISPATVYRSIVLPEYIKLLRHFQYQETADWLESLLPELEKIWDWKSFLDSGTLTCLLHGDSWNNNLLFRYESMTANEPQDMLLIDWQIARLGHPCHDLGYFLFSSTSSAFRRQHLITLLEEYYVNLSSMLAKLGIDLDQEGYSKKRFMQETLERFVLMMMITLFILPILLDQSKAVDHTLKNEDISEDIVSVKQDKKQEEDLDEEGTKDGWKSLFEVETVVKNSLLSQRIIDLINDVKEFTENKAFE